MTSFVSAFVSALDYFTPSQIGEKGSVEYTWSNNIRERIVQLSFQLTRTRDSTQLFTQTIKLLEDIENAYKASSILHEDYLEYMSLLYCMVAHTRDIIEGKGEYALSYMLIEAWHKFNPFLGKHALKLFVLSESNDKNSHPYGCWKDIKYLYGKRVAPELMCYATQLLIDQLKEDVNNENPSLAAKWVPREKSQFGDLFTELATKYFSDYLASAKTDEAKRKAVIKAKMDFRKLISSLNKKLDTVQIKQCANQWSTIVPEHQTSITMHRQKSSFLNVDKMGKTRHNTEDRINCANKFREYAERASKGEVEVKGKRIGLNNFTKEALSLIRQGLILTPEASILNAQWVDNSKQNGALGKMIAMVDVSGSMNGDPMNAAIALGIRVAEKSMLGKRVLTFSASPSWVNLDGKDTFIEMVETVRNAPWGMNTNFEAALNMILDAIVVNKLKPEDVEDMVLAIFSDMQIDEACSSSSSLMDRIEKKYVDAGNRLWGKPFKTPHILFWNLRSTSGFPTLSIQKNASMMAGFSPALLNLFCEEGLEALQSCTPWSLLVKSLKNERYKPMDTYIRSELSHL
jgi:hypothetical protein